MVSRLLLRPPMASFESLNRWILALALLAVHSEAAIKRWQPDTNFDNPRNWNLGRLPCPSDAIVFPTTAPEVFFPQDFTISRMVLPVNGALLLAADLTLVFNDNATMPDPPEGCPRGETIRFNHTAADAWLNPSSWCLPVHDFDADCLTDPQLDTEYVPCTYDDVLFARETSFFVNVDMTQTMPIRSLMIDNMYQTNESFRDYIETNEGKRRFTGAGLRPLMIRIQGLGAACSDPSGCFCGNADSSHINNIICSYRKCEPVPCPYPFIPVGHCCPICGSKMEFTYIFSNDTYIGFDVAQFRKLLIDEYIGKKELNYDLVHIILSKLMNGRVQLVLVDPDGGKQAAPMGVALQARIRSDATFKLNAGVVQVFNYAGSSAAEPSTTRAPTAAPRPPEPTPGDGGPWSPRDGTPSSTGQALLVVGLVGGAVAILLVALFVVFYRHRFYKGGAARPDTLAVSINFDDVNEPVTMLRGMANPMYNATAAAASAPASGGSQRDYVVSVNFTDRETPSAMIEKAAAGREKKRRGDKQASGVASIGLQNPMYDALGADQQQETAITATNSGRQSSAAASGTIATGGKGKKSSTLGLSNPLFGQQPAGSSGAAAETIGAASLRSDSSS